MNEGHNKIYAQIGKIATLATELEIEISSVAQSLIDDYRVYSRIITTELSYSGVIALLLSLYRARNGEDEDFIQLRTLTKKADVAQQKRNTIVHSVWKSAGAPQVVTRLKTTAKIKKGFNTQIENWTLDEFEDLSNEIVDLINDFRRLNNDLISKGKAFDNPVNPIS